MKDDFGPKNMKLSDNTLHKEPDAVAFFSDEAIVGMNVVSSSAFAREMHKLPRVLQNSERLSIAAKLIDDAAYSLAHDRPGRESTRLFLISASLEEEVKRMSEQNNS
jgi:hypothetical protein